MNRVNAVLGNTLTTIVPVKLVVAVKLQPCRLVNVAITETARGAYLVPYAM